ncbi:Panacea domain-containing protein [Polaromonas sp.]|uniref:Panacea domain-containing protein n=1 Tax=Polaromonas sp. TaxID=1869339 RepID=UPI00352B746D
MFNERKAAQAAAFLLYRAGGRLPLLKLVKLLYLSERHSLKEYGDTITGDSFVAMPHGPVLSMTYDHINGGQPVVEGGWTAWVADRSGNDVALRDASMIGNPEHDLLALSETDIECLEAVWAEFGRMDRWDLVKYTHSEACPEWEDPKGSSRPIPPARLFKAFGRNPQEVEVLTRRLHEQRHISALFETIV